MERTKATDLPQNWQKEISAILRYTDPTPKVPTTSQIRALVGRTRPPSDIAAPPTRTRLATSLSQQVEGGHETRTRQKSHMCVAFAHRLSRQTRRKRERKKGERYYKVRKYVMRYTSYIFLIFRCLERLFT